jgi:hypothetical protein
MLSYAVLNFEAADELGLRGKIKAQDLAALEAIRLQRIYPERVSLKMGELEYNLVTAKFLMDALPFVIEDPNEVPQIEKRLKDAGLISMLTMEDGRVFISTTEKADALTSMTM